MEERPVPCTNQVGMLVPGRLAQEKADLIGDLLLSVILNCFNRALLRAPF